MFLQRYCWWTCRTLGMSINCCLVTKSCLTLQPHGLEPAKFLCGWDFPGRKPGVGRHFLLQKGTWGWINLGVWDQNTYMTIYKIDNQQGPIKVHT